MLKPRPALTKTAPKWWLLSVIVRMLTLVFTGVIRYNSELMGLTSFDGRSFTSYSARRRYALNPNQTILNSFVSRVKGAFQAPQLVPVYA